MRLPSRFTSLLCTGGRRAVLASSLSTAVDMFNRVEARSSFRVTFTEVTGVPEGVPPAAGLALAGLALVPRRARLRG